MSDFDKVKAAVGIRQYLTDSGYAIRGNRTVAKWRNGERDSVSIDDSKGTWYDHKAGQGGSVIDLCMAVEGLDRAAALHALADRYGVMLDEAKPKPQATSRIVAEYVYTDANGKYLYTAVRKEPKAFFQYHLDANGKKVWNLNGVERVPYHLDELIKAVHDNAPIIIAEGEKDVDAIRTLGLVATTNSEGAGKWQDTHSAYFRGYTGTVTVIADRDGEGSKYAGQHHALGVKSSLANYGVAAKVVYVPDGKGKDAADFITNGATAADFLALAKSDEITPPWEAPDKPTADGAPERELAAPGITPMTGATFLAAKLPPPKWIVRDIIAQGMKGDLCGSSKTFKTFAALQLALSVAAGIDYLGTFRITEPHRVAYFNLELFDWNFQERLRAQAAALDITEREKLDNLLVFNLRGKGGALRDNTDAYIGALKNAGVEFTIIDPRYKLLKPGEDENTGDGLREVLTLRDRLSEHFATLFVTHDPKGDTSAKKTTDRGAGSYTAGADFDFRLTIDRAEKWAKDNLVYVIDSEGRARPTPAAFGVTFDSNDQTFAADETVAPIKLGTKNTPTTDPTIKAEREREAQEAFKAAALAVVNDHASRAGSDKAAALLNLDLFNAEVAKKPGGAVGVGKRDRLRKALVAQGVLVTCQEKRRDPKTGAVRNVKNAKTFISTPERIEAYLATFDNLGI